MPTQTTLSRVESFPFDSRSDGYDADGYPVYDRAVGASMLRATFEKFFSDGVFPSPGNALQISKGEGLTVTIQPGIFIIRGAMGGYLTDAHSLTLDTAAPQGNVCYALMLRYDETEQFRSCYIRVVRGDASSSPTPPAPDQSTPGVMEYRLGYVTVPTGATDLTSATVTNEKGLAVCPYAAPFEEIDMSEVTADAKSAANEALTQLLDYFETYRQMVDDAVDGTLAGSLQTQITALQQQLDNFDLSGSVDNETVVYNVLPGEVDKKLRVNQLSLGKDYLTIELQTELGILDTSDWDFDTYYSTAQGLSGDTQDLYIESIPAGAVNIWTASQLKQMIDLVSDEADESLISKLSSSTVAGWSYQDISQFFGMSQSLEASFIAKIPNSAVNSWEFDQIEESFQAVNDQNLPSMSAKVDTSTIQAWTTSQMTEICTVADTTFASRVASNFPVETCTWQELSYFANAVPQGAAASLVGKQKSMTLGGSYGEYTFDIVGVHHDDLASGGKAALSFLSITPVPVAGLTVLTGTVNSVYYYNNRENDRMVWTTLEAIDDLYPSDVKSLIKTVVKKYQGTWDTGTGDDVSLDYSDLVREIQMKTWTPSLVEVSTTDGNGAEGSTYQLFSGSDAASKRVRGGLSSSDINAWPLRTRVGTSTSQTARAVNANTGAIRNVQTGNHLPLVFGFCI